MLRVNFCVELYMADVEFIIFVSLKSQPSNAYKLKSGKYRILFPDWKLM